MPHAGISASSATVLWTQIGVLLLLARLLGALARRVGQPPIIGSLLAGLIAGPSVFGQVWPSGFAWFHPTGGASAQLLSAVADFALLMLLISLGAETDLPLIRSLGRSAASVTGGSLLLPLGAGAALAVGLPAAFRGDTGGAAPFVLLVTAAMSVSSLPVIARTMSEMQITRRNVGQLSIAAATVNDGIGFVVLALATALAGSGGQAKLLIALVGLVVLVALLATLGRWLLNKALRESRRGGLDVAAGVASCVVFTFVTAAIAQAAGIDAALGAFLAGIVIGRSRYVAPRVLDTFERTSDAIFAPLYFATAGLSVNVSELGHGTSGWWFLAMLAVAIGTKAFGSYGGARLAGAPHRDAAALGVALNGRGALQVILASAGLAAGILSGTAYTAIILLSILSSAAVPPVLRRALAGWRGTPEEQERLDHEREMSSNVIVRGQRLLLPSRGSPNSVAAARILDLAWPESSEVTMLQVADGDPAGLDNVRATLTNRQLRETGGVCDDVVSAVLDEADLGYGVIGVGAAEQPTAEHVLPDYIEALLNRSPIPLLIVRRGRDLAEQDGRPLLRPRRLLVPVTGSAASVAGQEIAHAISRNTAADVTLMHVVTRPAETDAAQREPVGVASGPAAAVLSAAQRDARAKDIETDVVVREAAFSGEEIERELRKGQADLVVVGTTVRRVDDHPFLGHTVDYLLQRVTGPTVVVVVLPDAQQAAADEPIDRTAG